MEEKSSSKLKNLYEKGKPTFLPIFSIIIKMQR